MHRSGVIYELVVDLRSSRDFLKAAQCLPAWQTDRALRGRSESGHDFSLDSSGEAVSRPAVKTDDAGERCAAVRERLAAAQPKAETDCCDLLSSTRPVLRQLVEGSLRAFGHERFAGSRIARRAPPAFFGSVRGNPGRTIHVDREKCHVTELRQLPGARLSRKSLSPHHSGTTSTPGPESVVWFRRSRRPSSFTPPCSKATGW